MKFEHQYVGPEQDFSGGPIVEFPPDEMPPVELVGIMSPELWHMGPEWEAIWEKQRGEGIILASLDTGYTKHIDGPEIVGTRSFIQGQSVVDSVSGHGTHTIGTMAGKGRIGVAPGAKILVGKVLSNQGSGGSDGIAAGIRWAVDAGAHIISMSLGGGGSYQPTNDAIDYAFSKGCWVNAAAGNAGFNGANTIGWPAKYPGCLCTGAYQRNGTIANFSSGGEQIDWACPGQDIVSFSKNGSGYASMSGTCIAMGSYVYGPEGPRKIEEILAGDTVFAYQDGKRVERVVSNVWNRGTNNVVGLSALGRDVTVTETHQMLCFDKKSKDLDWVAAKDIDPTRHRMVVPKELPMRVNPYIDSVVSVEFAYLLGYLIGDGWISETTRSRRVCVAEDGKDVVMDKIVQLYTTLFGKKLNFAKNGRWLYDDSTRVALLLEAAGLQGKSHEKTLPFWVWHVSHEKQDAILNGYFAADAHRRPKDGKFGLETVSGDLVRRIACLADYRGWKRGRVRVRQRSRIAPNSTQPSWRPTHQLNAWIGPKISTGAASAFGSIGKDKALAKMAAMGLDPSMFALGSITVTPDASTRQVFDLTVPCADNFFTHGLVTHNSMATPYGSGVLALLYAELLRRGYPIWKTTDEIRQFFRANMKDVGAPGFDVRFGFGIPVVDEVLSQIIGDLIYT